MLLSSSSSASSAAAGRSIRKQATVETRALRSARACAVSAAAAADKQQPAVAAAAATSSRRAALTGAAAVALALATSAAATAPAFADDATCTYATLANGLQWCDLREGDGPSPVAGAMVRAHYRGVLATTGKEFDSSYKRGRPLSFPVGKGNVIKGWDYAILGADDLPAMKEGGKRRVVIPAALAYGDRGAGGIIPPGASLDFVIELMPKRRN
jgi:FKBP-type peptidyl-prolyl cis-trans isomerase